MFLLKSLFPKIDCFGFSRFNESNECKIPRYIAPETWEQSIYSQESDVYSFGILMYEIITNQEAFCGNKFFEIPAKVTSGIRPEFKIQIQSSYKNLIEKCWSQNPSDRPTFNQILEELSDSKFITETIDEDYYLNYIDYINDYIEKISSFKDDISIEKFIKRKTKNFVKIESNEKNQNDEPIKNENISKTTNKNCAQNEDRYPNIDNETKIMFNKAVNILNGDGPLDNKKESLIILKNCADKGIVEAMALYSYFVRTGQFNPINDEEALKYLKMAADNGHLKSKHNYASCAYEGIGMQKNKNEALKYYKMAADEGCIESIINYSILLSLENDEEMQKQAAHYCRVGIEKGSEKSMQLYASLLSLGIGVQKDYKESIKYYKMAIDKGDKNSIIGLASVLEITEEAFLEKCELAKYYKMAANMLEKGDGIQVNKENALHYYKLAADNGDEESKKKYENMINGESEKVKINMLKKDADDGNIEAIIQYASMLYDGNGVPFDKFEAALYYKKAAEKGNIDAIEKLEKMFLYGIGVPVNYKECIKILSFGIDKLNDGDLYQFCYSEIKNENRKISISKIEEYLRNLADKGNYNAMRYFTSSESIFQNINRPIFENKTKINANNGDTNAMYIYAMMKMIGYCTQIDQDESKIYFELASQNGNIDAMYYNSNFHLKHPIDQDQSDYLKCLKKGADAGNVQCMIDYADVMYNGSYGPVNKKEAAKYYKMIIDKDKFTRSNKYAKMAFQGDGIPVDKKEAAKYFKIVADNGSLDSIIIYINILLTGDDIAPDKMQAARYIKMMSDTIGTKKTQEMLSPIFSEINEKNNDKSNQMDIFSISAETKVCIDDKSICYYYKKWADEGDIEYTEVYLNLMLNGAVGMPKNIVEAKRYLKILADHGIIYYILTYLGVCYPKADLFDEEFHKYCQVVETKGSADQISILADWMKEFDKIESARLFKIAENSK